MTTPLSDHAYPDSVCSRLDERSLGLRREIVHALGAGKRGHLAPALSLVEILRVLYDTVLRYDPKNPLWNERDRCILSKGHGCLALYVLLAEKGFFPKEELNRFCHTHGILGGHPEQGKVPGVEASTGSLGHGLPIGIGMALNARYERSPARVFVIAGDGETNEGSVWEGALCAGKHQLSNLTLLIDYNKYQSYGPVAEVQNLEPLADKWRSFNWAIAEVDGHDVAALEKTLGSLPLDPGKPSAVICHTIKGAGIKCAEHNLEWHHKSGVKAETVTKLLNDLGNGNA